MRTPTTTHADPMTTTVELLSRGVDNCSGLDEAERELAFQLCAEAVAEATASGGNVGRNARTTAGLLAELSFPDSPALVEQLALLAEFAARSFSRASQQECDGHEAPAWTAGPV